jgi:hypothetical protein
VTSWVILDRKDGSSVPLALPKDEVTLKDGDRVLIGAEPVPFDLHFLVVRGDGAIAAMLCLEARELPGQAKLPLDPEAIEPEG